MAGKKMKEEEFTIPVEEMTLCQVCKKRYLKNKSKVGCDKCSAWNDW